MKVHHSKYMKVSWVQMFSAEFWKVFTKSIKPVKTFTLNHPENERNELACIKRWKT